MNMQGTTIIRTMEKITHVEETEKELVRNVFIDKQDQTRDYFLREGQV